MTPPPSPSLLALSPSRAVWSVAWPMAAIGLLKTTYFLTDSWFVSWLGEEALAAAGGTAFGWWMIFLVCEIAGVGTHSLVARQVGGGRERAVGATLVQGLWVGAVAAVGLACLLPVRGLYFDAIGSVGAERALGDALLGAALLGAVSYAAHSVVDGVFRGLGDTRTPLALMIGTMLLNGLLNPTLIWGLGPAPELGIAGAAWATACARGLGALAGAAVLASRGHDLAFRAPDREVVTSIVTVGLPVSARGIAFSLVYVALARMINGFGPENLAALGLGHRIEGIAYMICVGFEVGAATVVGQHVGAGDVDGARRSAAVAARMASAIVLPVGLILFLAADAVYGGFAEDPATIDAGVAYLRIQTFVFVFMALEAVYEGAFTGAGDTVPPLWIGVAGTLLRLPAAWVLAWPLGLGVTGIWVAIAASTAIKGVALWAAFRRGGWAARLAPAPVVAVG